MTGGIVALVDGSLYARSVCDHAAWIAGRTGLPVELLHVIGRREAGGARDLSGAIALGSRSALLEELAELDARRAKLAQAQGRAILDDARAVLEGAGVAGATAQLRRGDLVEAVAEREADAALVVIGKRGEAADFARGHLGSNLERIARASRRPVVVASRAFDAPRGVLIAHDGGPSARRAVEHVAGSPIYEGLPVTVARAGSGGEGLEDARAALEAAGRDARTRVLSGPPEEALGRLVEEEGLGLVVMGAYGHSRIRGLVLGSTTTEMIRSCKVPVVLVR